MKIGDVTLDNNIILAPMAGVTDLPFRLLCKEQGAGMVCMEMVSAKAITYHNKNTEALMEISPAEGPVSLQLFGSEPDIMAEAAAMIEGRPFSVLDINMGCPVPKVAGNGEGSALMKDPDLVFKIVRSVSTAVNKPVTVKIRKGFDEQHVNAVEVALAAQEAGAKAVAVHGRTREQYYSGKADWEIIARVKETLNVPVIGNGDITSPEDAAAMFKYTGCDAVMVARAARGNPWLFARIAACMKGGVDPLPEGPDITAVTQMILRHAKMQCDLKGEQMAILQMRKHVGWYIAGVPFAAKLRRQINEVTTYEGLVKTLENLRQH